MHTNSITVLGAANLDIIAKSHHQLKPNDSNPGNITISPGGVGRNIAENLARLGTNTRLIAALGDDFPGRKLLNDCKNAGIDMSCCQINPDWTTPIYVAVLDHDGDMDVAISDVHHRVTIQHIRRHSDLIGTSTIIALDTNLKKEDIAEILDIFEGKDIYADTISITKADRIKNQIARFHTIKMNRLEASYLAGIEILDEDTLEQATEFFLDSGTKRVIISLGSEGLYYRSKSEKLRHTPAPIEPVNTTGAGDALMAGIIYGTINNKSAEYIVGFAQAMAHMALLSESAVNDQINLKNVERYNLWRNF